MSRGFTDRKRHIVIEEHKSKNWGSLFGCLLCGHMFSKGDGYRWVYANGKDSEFKYGNFFVCDVCDNGDEENKKNANALIPNSRILLDRLQR